MTIDAVARVTPQQAQRLALIVGAAGLMLCGIGALLDVRRSLEAYLAGYLFWLGAPLGAVGFAMIHHLTGGRWGQAIRTPLQLSIGTSPLMAVLFVPVLAGAGVLYAWAHEPVAASAYLNVPFFIVRALVYFAIWCGLSVLLLRWADVPGRAQPLSAAGLILLVLTVTFASIDWAMSLSPHWYSTIYGLLLFVSQGIVGMCVAVLLLLWLPLHSAQVRPPSIDQLHDLGNLLLMLVSLWAYLSFSQYLIIWSGNLPEETTWYVPRTRGAWGVVAVALIVFHFAVPFVLLLNRPVKRSVRPLAVIAALLLAVHLINAWWLLVPSFARANHELNWREPVAAIGIGGLWLWAWLWRLQRREGGPTQAGGAT